MRPVSFFTFALATFLSSFAACGTATGGRPITLDFAAVRSGPTSFTTTTGWDVVLDEAHLLVGAIYAFAPEDALARLSHVLAPVAHAHGGLDGYAGRPVRCEWLQQVDVDLVADGPTALGAGIGSYGFASVGTVLLDAPSGALADVTAPLHGHHAWVSGTATMGALAIPFEGGLDVPDEGTARLVEGVSLDATLDDGGEVQLHVAVSRWLDAVHFDRLADAGAAPRVLAAGTQAELAWLLALRDPSSWSMTYVAPEVP